MDKKVLTETDIRRKIHHAAIVARWDVMTQVLEELTPICRIIPSWHLGLSASLAALSF